MSAADHVEAPAEYGSLLTQLKKTLKRFAPDQRFLLGCSGGLDSLALMYALQRISQDADNSYGLRVVHVDHALQASSAAWAEMVGQQAQALHLEAIIKKVSVATGNVENEARKARYQAFREVIQSDEVLVLAHHQQDQAETVLMRLLNGSGVSGLAAMQGFEQREDFTILRPWLAVPRREIEQYAVQEKLNWVNDPANDDLAYDRVVLREKIWPVLSEHWAGFESAIARTALLMTDAESILAEQTIADLAIVKMTDSVLNIERLSALTSARLRGVLSRWMQGKEQYAPPFSRVEAVQHMMQARADAMPQILWQSGEANYQFRRYRNHLYRLPLDLAQAGTQDVILALGQILDLPSARWQVATMKGGLPLSLLGQALHLRPRIEGERLHLLGRIGSWPLKKLLQSLALTPWQREQVQILTMNAEETNAKPLALISEKGFWLTVQAPVASGDDLGWGLVRY